MTHNEKKEKQENVIRPTVDDVVFILLSLYIYFPYLFSSISTMLNANIYTYMNEHEREWIVFFCPFDQILFGYRLCEYKCLERKSISLCHMKRRRRIGDRKKTLKCNIESIFIYRSKA